ncbi:MAG: transglutaminase domain-containing protein, partial [Janthinobacterium lividum]
MIFTWLHHNILYDTVALYTNNLKPSTPASTLATGLAVCEGYAGLFATLGAKAGLETIVVGGHGKGLGYAQPAPGSSLPPFDGNHAWNAVRIDNGEWKLIDCCWGAGSVTGHGQPYNQSFTPAHFTRDNNDFGISHFPSNSAHFFRTDGRASISWAEYLLGTNNGDPGPQMFNGFTTEEGIAVESFLPAVRKL